MWWTCSKPSKTPTSTLWSPVTIRTEYLFFYANPPSLQEFPFCPGIHTKLSGCHHQNLLHCSGIRAWELVCHLKRMPCILPHDINVTYKYFHPTLVLLYANLAICHMKDDPLVLVLTQTVAYRGGGWCLTPPPLIPKALQNRAKLNPIVKTVKNCWI